MSKAKISTVLKTLAVIVAVVFGGVMMAAMYQGGGKSDSFSWFIPKADGYGVYYDTYDQALSIQWINNQKWDTENLTLSKNGKGDNVKFTFDVPIAGAETDYFGTMIGGGDYDDIIDLTYATDSPQQMVEDEVLIELTEYVEKYMPNYVAFLNDNPDLKELATVKDDEGKTHYYALYQVSDKPDDSFMGYCYRRDWVVGYADVPSHIWDLDNILNDINDPSSVDTSKIRYTDYYQAQANNDWTGWKEQTAIVSFTCEEGNDPNNDYTDNVIFPSGKNKPVYISDWEWMMRAFKKAIRAEGFSSDKDAYCTTLFYEGVMGTGDLYSSFGGGNPFWSYETDENGKKSTDFGMDSDQMRVYISAMNSWYKQGWMDTKFEQRSSDTFYKINLTGVSEGKVGMCQMGVAYPGTTIRTTSKCKTTKPMIFGCSLPINDIYGDSENKFVIPNSMYAESRLGPATGISTAAKNKNLPALFSLFNWLYSEEGSCFAIFGLNEEQYNSMTFKNDYYKKNGITSAYYEKDGMYYFHENAMGNANLQKALNGQRLVTSLKLCSKKGNAFDRVLREAMDEWSVYPNTTDITKYTTFMSAEQSVKYNNTLSRMRTYVDQTLPVYIKKGVTDKQWSDFKVIIGKYGYKSVNGIYDEIFKKLG